MDASKEEKEKACGVGKEWPDWSLLYHVVALGTSLFWPHSPACRVGTASCNLAPASPRTACLPACLDNFNCVSSETSSRLLRNWRNWRLKLQPPSERASSLLLLLLLRLTGTCQYKSNEEREGKRRHIRPTEREPQLRGGENFVML